MFKRLDLVEANSNLEVKAHEGANCKVANFCLTDWNCNHLQELNFDSYISIPETLKLSQKTFNAKHTNLPQT